LRKAQQIQALIWVRVDIISTNELWLFYDVLIIRHGVIFANMDSVVSLHKFGSLAPGVPMVSAASCVASPSGLVIGGLAAKICRDDRYERTLLMTSTENSPVLSLLWPDAESRPNPRLTAASVNDLDLDRTINALGEEHAYTRRIRDILLQLCDDPAVITYRQDVLADLIEIPVLAGRLADLLPRVIALDSWGYSARPDQSPLHEVVWRVGQLETYVEVVQGFSAAFDNLKQPVRAAGLIRLRDRVQATAADETFQRLVAELPDLIASVRGIASITIGVNLDDRLRPVEATLIAVNNRKFRGYSSSLLHILFGRNAPGAEWEGIAPLHAARSSSPPSGIPYGVDLDNPLLYPLFRDLADVLKKISRPVAAALHHYTRVNTRFLDGLGAELAFYLGAVGLTQRLRACGLSLCRPEIAPKETRLCEITGLYNVNLALRLLARSSNGQEDLSASIVPNDATFGTDGRIFVLTGPNQGGKTTYTQAVGLAQILAQAGLLVPGERARISPADNIYTHFPVEEQPEMESGRLGEEAGRLSSIFAQATRYSLLLLNESLASTSPGESLYLARDIVRTLRVLGARAIYATHLHELAANCDELNAETPGDSLIVSLVSLIQEGGGTGEITQTYRIVPGPPRGRSYARELAARYGISYEQLTAMLRARGIAWD
jgi:DNA mismatch repair protein MutS